MQKGTLVIISSPSGGGKDTVIRELLKIIPNSSRLITTTTRPPRPRETNGVDYFFITKTEFEGKIKENKFIEHNLYADNYYGTERDRVENNLNKFSFVFTNIEVNGKNNINKAGFENLSIFLMPESLEILRKRIEKRGGTDEQIIKQRLERAKKEMGEAENYDYQIVNHEGKLDETVEKVALIIKKELIQRQAVDKKE